MSKQQCGGPPFSHGTVIFAKDCILQHVWKSMSANASREHSHVTCTAAPVRNMSIEVALALPEAQVPGNQCELVAASWHFMDV